MSDIEKRLCENMNCVEPLIKHMKRYRKYMLKHYEFIRGYVEKDIVEEVCSVVAIAESVRAFFHYVRRILDLVTMILDSLQKVPEEGLPQASDRLDEHVYNQYIHAVDKCARFSAYVPIFRKAGGELVINGFQYQATTYDEKPLMDTCTSIMELALKTTDDVLLEIIPEADNNGS